MSAKQLGYDTVTLPFLVLIVGVFVGTALATCESVCFRCLRQRGEQPPQVQWRDKLDVILVENHLGCRFPVNSADVWLCLRKFYGKADRGRLAGQRREFKIHRKNTAQKITRDCSSSP